MKLAQQIRINGTVNDSIVDGPGFRFTIFTQGCPHHCPGCHNPETHAFDGGHFVEAQKLYDKIVENPLLSGVTLSGGDPMCQAPLLLPLVKALRERGLNICMYSGYTIEEIPKLDGGTEMLENIDMLVDGRFELAKRDLTLLWRGSGNQRVWKKDKNGQWVIESE